MLIHVVGEKEQTHKHIKKTRSKMRYGHVDEQTNPNNTMRWWYVRLRMRVSLWHN